MTTKLNEIFSCGGMAIQFDSFNKTAFLEILGLKSASKELSLDEIKFWAEKFNQALEAFEKIPKAGNKVKVVKGTFQGFEGIVFDIDNCDTLRPLIIGLKDERFDGVCFVGFDDVEVIRGK